MADAPGRALLARVPPHARQGGEFYGPGDQQRLGFLLDRTIGKVVDKTENHEYRINVNAHLDLIPKDKLIALLKDAESEGHVVDLGGENA